MVAKRDCTSIERANAELEKRIMSIDNEMYELQNLLDGLYADDPQRASLQKKIDTANEEKANLVNELQKGKTALQDCQQEM